MARHTTIAIISLFVAATFAPAYAQTAQTQQVMREKLMHAQTLLATLATSRWAQMTTEAQALDALTLRPGWSVLQSPEYVRDTRAFNVAVQALIQASERRDQMAAVKGYTDLVSSCVACHNNVARRRLAQGTSPGDLRAPLP